MKKMRQFVKFFVVGTMTLFFISNGLAQDTGTGTGWSEAGSSLLLNLKFQNFEHFHSQADANSGNSRGVVNPELDPTDPEYITPGYMDLQETKSFIGSSSSVDLIFYQCAFAPEWMTAYAYRDEVAIPGTGFNTVGVSNGFVEISREYESQYTIPGYFEIDLGNLPYIEMIQYSHSSTGGNKRGLMVEFSLDNGVSWDTLRYQPDAAYNDAFTKDIFTSEKTPNIYRCDPSSYGMLWEDKLYFSPDPELNEHLKIRFSTAVSQSLRIHDFIVYGDLPTALNPVLSQDLGISYTGDLVSVNEACDISIYSLTGTLIKHVEKARFVSVKDLVSGIYVIKAQVDSKIAVTKILRK
ncbi:T9SS type A sorting domain-containing protein [Geofilum sp. OHC36d9]|uniref:T9SS type A sorting domain-containing protein n=1 Tax=Geofilum sp. OHC36d9 TaxID=3458413 RepID=UPI00403416C0